MTCQLYIPDDEIFHLDLFKAYREELKQCENLDSLQSLIEKYADFSPDLLSVKLESHEHVSEFLGGEEKNKPGENPGEEWLTKYSSLSLPAYLFRAQILADKYQVPWGVAYFQLYCSGRVPNSDGESAKLESF